MNMRLALLAFVPLSWLLATGATAAPTECTNWRSQHPEWLWCDDFESDSALEQSYFEVDRDNGNFGVTQETAFGGTGSLKANYRTGVEGAGGLMLSLGRNPANYSGKHVTATNVDFDEVYWRFYTKVSSNWVGNAQKVTRATIFAGSNWSQAAIGHVWQDSGSGLGLGIDPATGVQGGKVVTTKYNDFANLRWLGLRTATTKIYAPENRNRWFCIEVRMKLNTVGSADGIFALWIDDKLEAEARSLDWRGTYSAYGINSIMLENWINDGAPQNQQRYMDNLVVSKSRIGCAAGGAVAPNPPTNLRVE